MAEAIGASVIGADATNDADLERLFNEGRSALGGQVDFLLHSIGMSPNVRKGRSYDDLNYEWYKQTLDVSAMAYIVCSKLHTSKRPLPKRLPWWRSATSLLSGYSRLR